MTGKDGGAAIIAVIFEVIPAEGRQDDYFSIAASLRPRLDDIDGFISVERFESLSQSGKILSLSFWRDEDAVKAWRVQLEHRQAQQKGRSGVFENYRLRVAGVIRDYGKFERGEVPA